MEIVRPMLFLGSTPSPTSNIMTTSRCTTTLNLCSNDDFLVSAAKATNTKKEEEIKQVENDDCGVVVDSFDFENKKMKSVVAGGKKRKEISADDDGTMTKKIKKHRYAFQTRSHVDVLDDGYLWRKYGQKSVKHNNFPRSYYKCTHQGCNVKKQIQRLSKDEEIVVTTYDGIHTHTTEKPTDNFEQILSQMMIYPPFITSSNK